MQKDTDPDFPAVSIEEAVELKRLRDLLVPRFGEGTVLGKNHTFVLLAMPKQLGSMSIIHNATPGRIADCMSHYIVACGYANVFPHFKPDAK